MAYTDLAATPVVANAALAQPTGTTGVAGGHRITGVIPERLLLRVVVANATTVLTVAAGENPPALESKAQAYSLAVGTHFVGPFSSAQVRQADGTVKLDYATAANFTVTPLALPKVVN
jgi:hypothetical protein